MTQNKNIVKGFVAIAAIAFLMVGCEKDEFERIDSLTTDNVVKGDNSGDINWGNDPVEDPNGDPTNPAGNGGRIDSIVINSTGGAFQDPVKTPWVPLINRKDDKVRDGSDHEEDDDGEDTGGQTSTMSDN